MLEKRTSPRGNIFISSHHCILIGQKHEVAGKVKNIFQSCKQGEHQESYVKRMVLSLSREKGRTAEPGASCTSRTVGHLKNVIQHQVHAAEGAFHAKAPTWVGKHWQAPHGQEKATGAAEESGLHRRWSQAARGRATAAVVIVGGLVATRQSCV